MHATRATREEILQHIETIIRITARIAATTVESPNNISITSINTSSSSTNTNSRTHSSNLSTFPQSHRPLFLHVPLLDLLPLLTGRAPLLHAMQDGPNPQQ